MFTPACVRLKQLELFAPRPTARSTNLAETLLASCFPSQCLIATSIKRADPWAVVAFRLAFRLGFAGFASSATASIAISGDRCEKRVLAFTNRLALRLCRLSWCDFWFWEEARLQHVDSLSVGQIPGRGQRRRDHFLCKVGRFTSSGMVCLAVPAGVGAGHPGGPDSGGGRTRSWRGREGGHRR